MKKHIMSGHGKKYINVASNGMLVNNEYQLVDILTYCGREYSTLEEAVVAGVKRYVVTGDSELCKICARWERNARDRRQSMLDRQAGSQWKEMQRI